MSMPHAIVLSDKAWSFIEARRGDKSPDSYVSMLIESVADLSGEEIATLDGVKVIDEIEAQASEGQVVRLRTDSAEAEHRQIARHTIDYLREAYHDKVPKRVFEKKCRDRGLTAAEIAQAEGEYGQWLR